MFKELRREKIIQTFISQFDLFLRIWISDFEAKKRVGLFDKRIAKGETKSDIDLENTDFLNLSEEFRVWKGFVILISEIRFVSEIWNNNSF